MTKEELIKENAKLKCECRRCVYTDSPCVLSDYGKDRNGICDHFKDVFDKNAELKKKLEQAEKVKVVEHFEAYGQCRDSRRIAELEAQIEKMKGCSNCKYKYIQDNADLGEGTRTDPCLSCRSHNMWEFED